MFKINSRQVNTFMTFGLAATLKHRYRLLKIFCGIKTFFSSFLFIEFANNFLKNISRVYVREILCNRHYFSSVNLQLSATDPSINPVHGISNFSK